MKLFCKILISLFLLSVHLCTFGQQKRLAVPIGHSTPIIKQKKISVSDKYLATYDVNKNLYLWDIETGASIKQLSKITDFSWRKTEGVLVYVTDSIVYSYSIKTNKTDTLKTHFTSIKLLYLDQEFDKIYFIDKNNTVNKQDIKTKNWNSFKISEFKHRKPIAKSNKKQLVALQTDKFIEIWDVEKEKKVWTSFGTTDLLKFSNDGAFLAIGNRKTASNNSGIEILEVATGKIKSNFKGHVNSRINDLSFSNDNQFLVSGANDNKTKVYNIGSSKLVGQQEFGLNELVVSCFFSKKSNQLIISTVSKLYECFGADFGKKKQIQSYKGINFEAKPKLSPSGNFIVSSDQTEIAIYDAESNSLIQTIRNLAESSIISKISPNGKIMATFSINTGFRGKGYARSIIIQDMVNGNVLGVFNDFVETQYLEFSKDGNYLLAYSFQAESVRVYDLKKIKLLHTYKSTNKSIEHAEISDDGKFMAVVSRDSFVYIFNVQTAKQLGKFKCIGGWPIHCKFWQSQGLLLILDNKSTLYKYDLYNQQLKSENSLSYKQLQGSIWNGFDFLPKEGLLLVWDNLSGAIMLYDAHTDDFLLAWYEDDTYSPCNVHFSGRNEIVSGNKRYTYDPDNIYSATNENWPLQLIDSSDFKGFSSDCPCLKESLSGQYLFQSSSRNNGVITNKLTNIVAPIEGHFTGITEVSFDLSERFIVTSGENDGSTKFWDIKTGKLLFTQYFFDGKPDQWLIVDTNGYFDATTLAMKLLHWIIDGEVVSFEQLKETYWIPGLWGLKINGKGNYSKQAISKTELYPDVYQLSVSNDSLFVHIKRRSGGYGPIKLYLNGKEIAKDIRGKSFNTALSEQTIVWTFDTTLLSTGKNSFTVYCLNKEETIKSKGAIVEVLTSKKDNLAPPKFYGIVIGVGKYATSDINLNFPENDAAAIQKAMTIAANNLFGKENTSIRILSTGKGSSPSKSKIEAVFDTIAQTANSNDVVFLYLSGHGLSDKKVNGDFYFLTKDANSTDLEDLLRDSFQSRSSVSSSEWINLINKLKSQKHFMVIDACGSGRAVEHMSQQKGIRASQIKAIDRMKDRTGMFILSGCAADAVSYESSVYGQGLLTYAMLEGMRGAALKSEGQVDVQSLMMHARERVPLLAKDLGNLAQEPQCLYASDGFSVGIVTENDKVNIPLANPKSVVISSMILNINSLRDDLNMTTEFNRLLSVKSGISYVYFPVNQYPDAISLTGLYSVNKEYIELTLVKSSYDGEQQFTYKAKTKEELIIRLEEWLEGAEF